MQRRYATMAVLPAALLLLAAALPLPAAAADCAATAWTQAEINTCAGVRAGAADTVLNASYQKLYARLTPAGRTRLRTAQRAWLAWRDAECSFRSDGADGGSMAPTIAAGCAAQLAEARTKELAGFASCPEGDLSCPQ